MKANRKAMTKDEGAQVGIGTLIIFIAMVLVAAVAAAVLINTSGTLQQKAQTTGKEATEEVSSNIMVQSVGGNRGYSEGNTTLAESIQLMDIRVKLAAGSAPIDLRQLIISINDGQKRVDLQYNSTGDLNTNLTWNEGANATYNGTNTFIAEEVRDEDDSFDKENNPVINTGDLAKIYVDTSADTGLNLDLTPRSDIRVTLIPETGTPVSVDVVMPNSYGTDRYVNLYP